MAVRLKTSEKLELISNLGAMISAGIPLLESVEALLEGATSRSKTVLEALKSDLESGKTIATSFSRFQESFDAVDINLVRGGEEAGNLEEVLRDLAETLRREIEFNRRVKGALAYPAFISVVFVGIMIVILTFVMPRIAQVFTKLNVVIPLPTRFLIASSNIFINYWPAVISISALIIAGLLALYHYRRRQLIGIVSSLPYVSKLFREIDLVRFTRSLSLLLSSGIPISKSLELSQEVLVRPELIKLIEFSRKEIIKGKRLTDSFKTQKEILPPIFIRIVDAGERSGKLEESFQEAANYFDGRVSDTIKTITTLLEPVILVTVGIVVGGIMISIIAPIYQLVGQIQIR